ncbi:hypothetical protein DNTS_035427 [Danionella cerebrum]|uniref:Ras-associating domain-containing protein n=1 Tax=Danionella cerebrum TaxID=2873325 RepID=A0A553MM22_9TELE|nr:hypothetical protein DNTS_035427 [Danionella translucida]TRY54231.1 hypothetical protein DNTS_035427 [Danionella translucida]
MIPWTESSKSDSTAQSAESTGVRQPARSKIRRQNHHRLTSVFSRSPVLQRQQPPGTDLQPEDETEEMSSHRSVPGILKIFGSHICQGTNYKSVLATRHSSARELVKEALERYSLEKEDPGSYVLCDVIGKTGVDYEWKTECCRVVGDSERPLMLQSLWKPKEGFSRRFEIQKRAALEALGAQDTFEIAAGPNAQVRKLHPARSRVTSLFVDGSGEPVDSLGIWRSLSDMNVSAIGTKESTEKPAAPPQLEDPEADKEINAEKEETESSDDNNTQYSVHLPFDFPYFLLLQGYTHKQCVLFKLVVLEVSQRLISREILGLAQVRAAGCEQTPDEDPLLRQRTNKSLESSPPTSSSLLMTIDQSGEPQNNRRSWEDGALMFLSLQEFLIYLMSGNTCVFGSASEHPSADSADTLKVDILLFAPDVSPNHCLIHRLNPSSDTTEGRTQTLLRPLHGAPVSHNGVPLEDQEVELCPGDLVGLGQHYLFMFKDPSASRGFQTPSWMATLCSPIAFSPCKLCGTSLRRRRRPKMAARWRDVEGRVLALSYQRQEEEQVLEKILKMADTEGEDSKLTPAFLMCLCIQHSTSAHELVHLRRLLLSIANGIQLNMWVSPRSDPMPSFMNKCTLYLAFNSSQLPDVSRAPHAAKSHGS